MKPTEPEAPVSGSLEDVLLAPKSKANKEPACADVVASDITAIRQATAIPNGSFLIFIFNPTFFN